MVVFNEAGEADVPIGGHGDIVRTGEYFQREFFYTDECGVARDFTNLAVESAVVYNPLTLATLATITVTVVAPAATSGTLRFVMDNTVMGSLSAGEWMYRARFTDGGAPRRTVQAGRFIVGDSPA